MDSKTCTKCNVAQPLTNYHHHHTNFIEYLNRGRDPTKWEGLESLDQLPCSESQ